MGLLDSNSTFYGFKSQEVSRTPVGNILKQKLDNYDCTGTALVTRSQPKDKNGMPMMNNDGTPRLVNSICLTLVSNSIKNPDGTPMTGAEYFPLSTQSELRPGDAVDISSMEEIVLAKIGSPNTKVYDAKKAV